MCVSVGGNLCTKTKTEMGCFKTGGFEFHFDATTIGSSCCCYSTLSPFCSSVNTMHARTHGGRKVAFVKAHYIPLSGVGSSCLGTLVE